jgi:molybdenum cofactor biosynthesis protein B
MSYSEHKLHKISARCAIITTSDTRTLSEDESGAFLEKALSAAGHKISAHALVPNDGAKLHLALDSAMEEADVVIITGGTGISHKDITIETVAPMITKELPGFGEMFRALSFAEIGSGAMLSRAIAGTIGQKVVFCTPGSLNAVKLAAEKLIIPELSHLIWEATK